MSKISLTNLVNLQNETTAVNNINGNNATIITAFDNTLSRDGTSPNQMGASLDMNSHSILNLPAAVNAGDAVRLADISTSVVPASGYSFFAHNNNSNLVYTPTNPNNYYLFKPSTTKFNIGSFWSNNRFTPPPGTKVVYLNASIFINSASTFSGNFECKWVKNFTVNGSNFQLTGTDVGAGQGSQIANSPGVYFVQANVLDSPTTGDYYGLFLYIDAFPLGSTTVTVNGNPAHTYIQGIVLA